jgi:hypothetical protein
MKKKWFDRCLITFLLAAIPLAVLILVFGSNPIYARDVSMTVSTLRDTDNFALEPSSTISSVVPIGNNFPIALDKGDTIQGKPAIAFDGTNFFVVWADLSNYNIYGARVALDGTVLDPDAIPISISLNDLARQPSVDFDGVNFFVTWCATRSGTREVYGARVTTTGTVLDPPGIKLTTGGDALDRMPGIAFDGTNHLVVWRTPSTTIRAARVTTAGINLDTPAGFPIAISGTSKYPAVAFDGVNYMVVWHKTATSTQDDIYGARVTKDGFVLDPEGFIICDAPMNQNYPTIAFNGTNYLVVWYDWRSNNVEGDGSAYGARVTPNGTVLDDPAFIIANRVRGQVPVQLTVAETEWFVTYMEGKDVPANFRLTDVYSFRISADGQIMNQQGIPVSTSFGHQFGPAVGYGDGWYLVAWGDIFRYSGSAIYGQMLQSQTSGDITSINRLESQPSANSALQVYDSVSSNWVQENTALTSYGTAGLSFNAMDAYAFGVKQLVHYQENEWISEQNIEQDYVYGDWITDTGPSRYASNGLAISGVNSYAFGSGVFHYDGIGWSTEFESDKHYGGWASGPESVWVGGWCRGIFHYDGISWTHTGCWTSHSTEDIVTAIWGDGGIPLWATCDRGDVLKYEGSFTWSTMATGVSVDLWDLWGTTSNNIYAVGSRGTVIRYSGSNWDSVGTPTNQALNGVWGSGPNDIFAVGDWGTIIHYDGTVWSAQDSGTTEHLFDIWGFDNSDVYAVGFNGTILHYDGNDWQPDASGVDQDLLAVWGVLDLEVERKIVWTSGRSNIILKKTIPTTVYREYLPVIMCP